MSEHCGTSRGYRRHSALKEPTCPACTTWRSDYRAANKAARPEPGMTAAELIDEIERLLSYGEGEYGITSAVGYHGRERALQKRLRYSGRTDLNERIFWAEGMAA